METDMYSLRYYLPHVPEENYKRKDWAQSVLKYVGGLIGFTSTIIFLFTLDISG